MRQGRVLVRLIVDLGDASVCKSVLEALKVDDVELPESVQLIERTCEDSKVVYLLATSLDKAENLLKLWSTLDDLLRCMKAAYQTLQKTLSDK